MVDLSIIVPVYNGERYLKQLLDSIHAITIVSMEVLFIDDGSADNSGEIIKAYMEKDRRFSYCKKENGGIVSARNYGLQRATGEFLFFADQDDVLEAAVLEKAVAKLKKEKADMLLFSTEYVNDAGNRSACDTVSEEGVYTEKEIGDLFIRKLVTRYAKREVVTYIGHIWAAVISRKLVAKHAICFKRFISIEDDLLFVLDSIDHAKRLITMCDTGYYWRKNPDSRTRKMRYIEDFAEKKRRYYGYRTEILKRHGICNDEELEKYYTGIRQEFILDMLDNEGLRSVWKAYPALKKYVKNSEIREALLKPPCCPLAGRYRMEKHLLSKGRVFLVLVYKKGKYGKAMFANRMRRCIYHNIDR